MAVIFLGLLSRQPDVASIARWAKHHWPVLKEAFGLTRRYAPHATTYSRVAADFSVEEFRSAWPGGWPGSWPPLRSPPRWTARPAAGPRRRWRPDPGPQRVRYDARVSLGDESVGDGKETEPEVLKARLDDLFARWPSLRVLTGDALFCQRPLARAIIDAGRVYVLAVKDNQPDRHERIRTAFADATPATADATTREKRAGRSRPGTSGVMRPRPSMPARR